MRTDGEGWRVYAGFRFRETGRLRFEFASRSQPGTTYITDVEDKYCSCWPHTKQNDPTGVCPHFRVLQQYFNKLAKAMNEIHADMVNKQQTNT